MSRRIGGETNKKEEILCAAQSCFLAQGFDGTSVRDIMKRAGAEIGLFYYYFKNKDEAFDRVLDRLFADYEADFARIVAHGRRNPCRLMEEFFSYMERETQKFRDQYSEQMHRSVRWAIREQMLAIIEPYLREVVAIQSAYYGVPTALDQDVAALYLTHGVGSAILHEDAELYQARRTEIKRGTALLMGMPMDRQEIRIPYPAKTEDTQGWMALVRSVRASFPGLEEAEYERELAKRIAEGEAWVIRDKGKIAAALIYSAARREIDFLAVAPDYRRLGLAQKLMETAAAQFEVGTELSVLSFREGDPAGIAACAFYRALGFVPGEDATAFAYPVRRYTISVPDGPLGFRGRTSDR